MVEFQSIKNKDYSNRVRFWPNKIVPKNKNYFGEKYFNDDYDDSNFWLLSEQYYTLTWTLYTAEFNERKKWAYAVNINSDEDNILSDEDKIHKKLIEQKIVKNNWSAPTFLTFAHLSCELAFKAIIFHKTSNLQTMSYPKCHDLNKLFNLFNIHTQDSFRIQYNDWSAKADLEEIIFGSGNRFINQRYGDIDYTSEEEEFGTIKLCRFIHEKFNLENIQFE